MAYSNKIYLKPYQKIALSPPQTLVLGFAIIILVGAFILTLPGFTVPGKDTDFLTALFTATSAVCVTGLVVVDTGTHWTLSGQVLILTLIQIGGIGFMTMAMIFYIIMGKKIGLKSRLIIQESLNQINLEGIVRLVKIIFLFTLGTELAATIILGLWWGGEMGLAKGLWFGFFHSVTAFNNAGFDLFGDFRSLTGYRSDPVTNVTVTMLIIIGGLGFSVVYDFWKYKKYRKRLSLHSRLVLIMSLILVVIGTILFMALEWNTSLKGVPWQGKLLASYFQGITPRTAGFNTVDLTGLRPTTLFFLILLMFIGASPGSTGGGIKTTTFALMFLAAKSVSTGKEDIIIYHRTIPSRQVYKALAIFLLSLFWVIIVTILLTITEDADFLTILFESISAFATVGLSLGFTPNLSELGRVIILLTMFMGRLGLITVAFAIAQRNVRTEINYPEEKIMVG